MKNAEYTIWIPLWKILGALVLLVIVAVGLVQMVMR
jgi:hypothetical protein